MTISPISAAAAAFMAGEETAEHTVLDTPDPELERLLKIQAEFGSIPKAEYEKAKAVLGRSTRQIQRLLANVRSPEVAAPGRQGFELTEHHRQVIFAYNGNVALAYRELERAGEELPHEDTFWRAWRRQPAGIQAYARKGAEGIVECWLYPPYEAPERNAVWQADHFELPIDVIGDGHGSTLVKPWLTIFEDDRSRKVMAWHLEAEVGSRPDAEVVCATLAAGITIRREHGVDVGGVPRVVRWDNDASFNAGMVMDLGTQLGFECHAVPPYSGHMKGKVERLGKRIEQGFCAAQPGFTHGVKTYRQRNPFRDTAPLTAAQLRLRLDQWLAEYDTTRHEGIGEAPIERWKADTTPLRRAASSQLRPALLVEKRLHKVQPRKGVFFKTRYWMSGALMDFVGQSVEIHYPMNNEEYIELYQQGRWCCTAYPANELTEDQRREIFAGRRDMYAEARELQDQAARLRQEADAAAGATTAVPAIAAVPAEDSLAADAEDLYELLGHAAGPTIGDAGQSDGSQP